MKEQARTLIKSGVASLGLYIARRFPDCINGYKLEDDLAVLIPKEDPLCFDIGANQGQTIHLLQRTYKRPVIHAFEPSSVTFSGLKKQRFKAGVHLHQFAFGERTGVAEFRNYQQSELNSFLTLNRNKTESLFATEELLLVEPVQVDTLDRFCTAHAIGYIHLLKIDTQGFELPILRGGVNLFREAKVGAVLLELNFATLYEGQSDPLEILHFLRTNGMQLVDFYEKERITGRALSWTTALFQRRA